MGILILKYCVGVKRVFKRGFERMIGKIGEELEVWDVLEVKGIEF